MEKKDGKNLNDHQRGDYLNKRRHVHTTEQCRAGEENETNLYVLTWNNLHGDR